MVNYESQLKVYPIHSSQPHIYIPSLCVYEHFLLELIGNESGVVISSITISYLRP